MARSRPDVLHEAARFAEENGLKNFRIREGDALVGSKLSCCGRFYLLHRIGGISG